MNLRISGPTKNKYKRLGSRITSVLGLYMRPKTPATLIRGLVDRLVPHDLGVPLVRLGGSCDGGYLVPDDLAGVRNCFSPGVGQLATFEQDLYAKGIRSFLADYSVDGPPAPLPDCDFEKKFVGASNSDTTVTLDRWVQAKCPDASAGDLMLQMDIETAEYETLLATSPETLSRFRIIVLELHKLNHLDNRLFFRFVDATISKLLGQFEVAHLHPNNCAGLTVMAGLEMPRVAEITLLRKDRVVRKAPLSRWPHPLDFPNTPGQPEIVLPEYWWRPGLLQRAA
jgi:hypothetical protein